MADKHNAGPWAVEPLQATHGADMAICAPGVGVIAVIHHDPDIQDCEEPDGDSVKWHPEDLANAALIAEAPTLLEVLRRFAALPDAMAAYARAHGVEYEDIGALLSRVDAGDATGEEGGDQDETCQHCGEERPLGPPALVWQCGACDGLNPGGEG